MAYSPVTDFLALFRTTSGGQRAVRAPTLDIVLSALSRAGLFDLYVGATAPTTDQATTAWLVPATQSWTAEGALYLWDADLGEYAPATPALFSALITAAGL